MYHAASGTSVAFRRDLHHVPYVWARASELTRGYAILTIGGSVSGQGMFDLRLVISTATTSPIIPYNLVTLNAAATWYSTNIGSDTPIMQVAGPHHAQGIAILEIQIVPPPPSPLPPSPVRAPEAGRSLPPRPPHPPPPPPRAPRQASGTRTRPT